MKKLLVLALVAVLSLGILSGCSKPDPDKQALLLVSFGTSYADTRAKTLDVIYDEFKEEFTSYDVYEAYTAQIIIDILADREIIKNNVREAFEELKKNNYGKVVVQSSFVMNGAEYDEMMEIVREYEDSFNEVVVGKALLTSADDYLKTVDALSTQFDTLADEEAIVFFGHGTHHHANSVYPSLEYNFNRKGFKNVFVGTVEGSPTFEDVVAGLNEKGIKKVTLMPLMIVAGDHAENDMAGDEADSWKVMLKEEGFEVETYLYGMGENPGIRAIMIEHAIHAIEGEH